MCGRTVCPKMKGNDISSDVFSNMLVSDEHLMRRMDWDRY